MDTADSLLAYERIADEYYDSAKHPTCASLRELSSSYLISRLAAIRGNERLVVEVGTGKSIVAPYCAQFTQDLRSVVLLDSSPGMLRYSRDWEKVGARLVHADASNTGLDSGSADLIVASLGDPYNTNEFWKEVARILRPGGKCLFTTPAYEWAKRFRPADHLTEAEFLRTDGAVLLMPSFVCSEQEQVNLIIEAGLTILESEAKLLRDFENPPASKLLCVSGTDPVLRCYTVTR